MSTSSSGLNVTGAQSPASYNNDRIVEYTDTEIAIFGTQKYTTLNKHMELSIWTFTSHYRHDDLKQMLDTNKDSLKLEAMKRIIGMVAKGKDASDLFPAVVKNVVSKNIEVKKLVYVYLVRYAEEQQDLALLSISTFQRALKASKSCESLSSFNSNVFLIISRIPINWFVPAPYESCPASVSLWLYPS